MYFGGFPPFDPIKGDAPYIFQNLSVRSKESDWLIYLLLILVLAPDTGSAKLMNFFYD